MKIWVMVVIGYGVGRFSILFCGLFGLLDGLSCFRCDFLLVEWMRGVSVGWSMNI